MRLAMIDALEKKYEAEIAAADATIKIYLENSVGIGEHPQHLEEIDKLLQKIVDAEEKLKALIPFRLWLVKQTKPYIAGLFDGEGSIQYKQYDRQRKNKNLPYGHKNGNSYDW